jgi:hypothetical protein
MINLNGVWHSRHVTISFRAARESFLGGWTIAIFSMSSPSSAIDSSFKLRLVPWPARLGVTFDNKEKGAMVAGLLWAPLLRFLVLVVLLLLLLLLL